MGVELVGRPHEAQEAQDATPTVARSAPRWPSDGINQSDAMTASNFRATAANPLLDGCSSFAHHVL